MENFKNENLDDINPFSDDNQSQFQQKCEINDISNDKSQEEQSKENLQQIETVYNKEQSDQIQQEQPEHTEKINKNEQDEQHVSPQNQAYNEAVIERKKLNFNLLKDWDDKRAAFLNQIKEIMEIILGSLDSKISLSIFGIQGLIKFLTEKICIQLGKRILRAFGQQIIQIIKNFNTIKLIIQNYWGKNFTCDCLPGSIQSVLRNGSSIANQSQTYKLVKYYQINNNIYRRYCEYLDKHILSELKKENEQYNKYISNIQSQIEQQNKYLEKLSQQVVSKSQKYSKAYYNQMQNPNYKKSKKFDLFLNQIQFIKYAEVQIEKYRELGILIINYWEEIFRLEVLKIEKIQLSIKAFLQKESELNSSKNIQFEIPLKILECLKSSEECQNYFSVDLTLPQDIQTHIKQKINKQNLSFQDIVTYITKFEILPFNDSNLILKKFIVERGIVQYVGGLTKKFVQCQLIITIDLFMLLFDLNTEDNCNSQNLTSTISRISKFSNKQNSVNLKYLQVKQRKDPKLVDLKETLPGIIFNNTKSFLLKFECLDLIQELKHFIELAEKTA